MLSCGTLPQGTEAKMPSPISSLLTHPTYSTNITSAQKKWKITSLPSSLKTRKSSHRHSRPRSPQVLPFSPLICPRQLGSWRSLPPHLVLGPTFLAVSQNHPHMLSQISPGASALAMSLLFLAPFIASTGLPIAGSWL